MPQGDIIRTFGVTSILKKVDLLRDLAALARCKTPKPKNYIARALVTHRRLHINWRGRRARRDCARETAGRRPDVPQSDPVPKYPFPAIVQDGPKRVRIGLPA